MAKSLLEKFRAAQEILEGRHGSQRKAAEACGVSQQSWGQWRKGRVPRVETIEKIITQAMR